MTPEPDALPIFEELQSLYRRSGGAVRAQFEDREEAARQYYARYLHFVARSAGPGQVGALLDVGCGTGWSTYFFAQMGWQAVGIDVNGSAFEPPSLVNLCLLQASAVALPFPDAVFDVVTAHQTLEHIPDPRTALSEMVRVCRPGGIICIVGPNLLSLGMSARAITGYVWRNRPVRRVFLRSAGMPRHPFGNTLPEALVALLANVRLLVQKAVAPDVSFSLRVPDLIPPFHSDNDACYLCNPIDLAKFFCRRGCRIIRNGPDGRLPGTSLIAGGTWVAVCKPEARIEHPMSDETSADLRGFPQ